MFRLFDWLNFKAECSTATVGRENFTFKVNLQLLNVALGNTFGKQVSLTSGGELFLYHSMKPKYFGNVVLERLDKLLIFQLGYDGRVT